MPRLRIEAIGRGVVDLYTEHICFASKSPCDDFIELNMSGGQVLKVKKSDYELIGVFNTGINRLDDSIKRKRGKQNANSTTE